jgi:simple sugar transport system ATP-binding protein
MMVGRAVQLVVDKETREPGPPALEVANVVVRDDRGHVTVNDVSLEVRAGEIVAIAGVQGNGQEELAEALLGLRSVDRGTITLHGNSLVGREPHGILRDGVGFVPEDRQHNGLVGQLSVAENLVLDLYDQPPFASGPAMNLAAIARNATERVDEFDVRTSSTTASANTLSGGNQQKVVLARELSRPLKLLIVAQPTRGLDVGSMEFVHRRIVAERDRGAAVVLVSTELDEVLGLADRIGVMYRGKIAGEVPGGASAEEIGLLMAGSHE